MSNGDLKPAISSTISLEDRLVEAVRGGDASGAERLLLQWIGLLEAYASPVRPLDLVCFERFSSATFGRYIYTHAFGELWIDGLWLDLIPAALGEHCTAGSPVFIEGKKTFPIRVPLQLVFDRAFHSLREKLPAQPDAEPFRRLFPLPAQTLSRFVKNLLFLMHDPVSCALFEKWFTDSLAEKAETTTAPRPFGLPQPVSGVSMVVPVFNKADLTRKFIFSLAQSLTETIPFECLVVDNASSDGTEALLSGLCKTIPWLRYVKMPENRWYGGACNAGAAAASFSHVLFLNNDMHLFKGWLEPLVDAFHDERLGAAGARLVYPDFFIQHAGVTFLENLVPSHVSLRYPFSAPEVTAPREFTAVTGACCIMPKKLFDELGGFDLSYKMYYEDIDLCFRIRAAGRRIVYVPECVVVHFEGASSPSMTVARERSAESRPVFLKRWGAELARLLTVQPELIAQGIPYTRPASSSFTAAGGIAPVGGSGIHPIQTTDKALIAAVAALVEAGHVVPALEYYSARRVLVQETSEELRNFDRVIEKLRSKFSPQ